MPDSPAANLLTDPAAVAALLDDIGVFLARWKTASLATVDEAGRPHAANVQYASIRRDSRIELFYVSNETSAHSRHIAHTGQVAMTIYAHVRRPDHIHGVQLHGNAAPILRDTPEWDAAWHVYSRRYPFVLLPPLRQRIAAETFYRVTPAWVRFVDNRKGFGFKRECDIRP